MGQATHAEDLVFLAMLFYGVVSNFLDEAVELFPTREEAEAVVRAWDRDEPDQAGIDDPRH